MDARCDYYGCEEPQAPGQPEAGMRFCAEHYAEVVALIRAPDPGPLFGWYVRAQGGPRRAARRMLHGPDESKWPKG